jgi:hypothetical protein
LLNHEADICFIDHRSDDVLASLFSLAHNPSGAAVMRLTVYSGSFVAGALVGALMMPCLVSAGEVTPGGPVHGGSINSTSSMWLGFAVSPNRRVFKSDPNVAEIAARNAAKNECEATTIRTCNAIAVPEAADVAAVGCTYNGRSNSFVGGSAQDAQLRIALNKANDAGFPDSSCIEFYTY